MNEEFTLKDKIMRVASMILPFLLPAFLACSAKQSSTARISPEEAKEDIGKLERAANKNPQDAGAHYHLAEAHLALGETEKALAELEQTLAADSTYLAAYRLRARVYQNLGRQQEVFAAYLKILELSKLEKDVAAISQAIGAPFRITRLDVGSGNNSLARFSPDGQKIAWQSDRDGDWNIFIGAADGSAAQALTYETAQDEAPAFSPDGQWIVFTSTRDELAPRARGEENREIYLMNLSTKAVTRLTKNNYDDWAPQFSNDGKGIIYVSEAGDNRDVPFPEKYSNLYYYSFLDSTSRPITHDAWDNTSPISLNEGMLAWLRIRDSEYSILLGLPGGTTREILSDQFPKSGIAATADGKQFCFFMKRSQNVDIYEVKAGSANPRRLTAAIGEDTFPAYSPDGGKILYTAANETGYGLRIIHLNEPISRDELRSVLLSLSKSYRGKSNASN